MALFGNGNAIVLLDDDSIDRRVARRTYARSRVENPWQEFARVSEFLAYMDTVREEPLRPAAVLLDINMPEMSGFEVLTWIRAQPEFQENPVVCIFTTSNALDDQAWAEKQGASCYWTKPSTLDGYVSLFDSLVDPPSEDEHG